MIKKIALLGLVLATAAQADSSCDVTSRLYGGIGLGFSSGHAPLLKQKFTGSELAESLLGGARIPRTNFNKLGIAYSYKKMRGLATRLALGGHFVIPNTCLVLGAEMSFGIGGPKGRTKIVAEKKNISTNGNAKFAEGSRSISLRDRWNLAFTGLIGAKVGRILPYAKVGVAIHSFKTTESEYASYSYPLRPDQDKAKSPSDTTRKKRPLFVMGLGVDYNVTKNIIVGAEWTHHRGTLGFLNKEERKVATREEKKMDKIRINEFMVTCKYAFPVTR